jgi:hypothetical protein
MKFKNYLEKRLTKKEISDIAQQARLEKLALQVLQKDIAQALGAYIKTSS